MVLSHDLTRGLVDWFLRGLLDSLNYGKVSRGWRSLRIAWRGKPTAVCSEEMAMWRLAWAEIGVVMLLVVAGCGDTPAPEAPEIQAVNEELPANSTAAKKTSTVSRTDVLLAALKEAAEDNDPPKEEKDEKKAKAAVAAQFAKDLTEALKAAALRARIDGNGKPIVLDFYGRYLTDDGLAKLKDQATLQQLFLNGQVAISDIGLEHLKGLTALKILHLRRTPIGDSNLEALSTLKALQQLDLSETKVGSAGLEHLKALTALVQLNLSETPVTDVGLLHLKGLSNLKMLDLSDTEIGSAGMGSVSALKLEELRLGGTNVDDVGIAQLKGMTSLRQLVLSGGIGDKGLDSIKTLTGLVRLDVGGSGTISDVGIEHLKGMTGMQRLDLSATGLTDSGLLSMKGLGNLQYLDLSQTKITDSGLRHLKGLANLKQLDLTGTAMRGGAVRQLQTALPNCRIVGATAG
ncbi:MAG: hypothetical protein CMJ45_13805 [Planctomyces sp.]|nr:hypothetical protein [Planctomyces sp.]